MLVASLLGACSTSAPPVAPIPPQDSTVFSSQPDGRLVDYLRSEKVFADKALFSSARMERELTGEILENTSELTIATSLALGPFEYFSVQQPTLRHPIIYRRRLDSTSRALVLDPNVLFNSYPQAGFGILRIAPEHSAIAFTADLQHSGIYSLFVWDIGKERVTEVSTLDVQDVEWGSDDCALFFTERERGRARALHAWNCRNPASESLLFNERDAAHAVSLRRAKNGDELIVASDSQVLSKVFVLPLRAATPQLREIRPFSRGAKFTLFSHPQSFFVHKADGTFWKLSRGSNARAQAVALPKNTRVVDIDVFRDALLVLARRGARPALQVYHPSSDQITEVELPDSADSLSRLPNPGFESEAARIAFESLISPRTIAEVHLAQARLTVAQPAVFPVPYSAQDFHAEHLSVRADDGADIPLTVASLRKTEGSSPVLLLGYGAYATVSAETFSAARLSLLRRGFRIAVAHVRGDGILGQNWYDAGRRMNKKRAFDDFRACARFLIDRGYSEKNRLFAYGKSAGGLLVAVAAGSDRHLFKAIVLDRPFVDVIAGLNAESSGLAVREHEEWGDPRNRTEAEYIMSYSPAQQIAKYSYPPMLVVTGMRDLTVPYWDVARWFALLRAKDRLSAQQGGSEKYLWVSTSAAHEGEVDDYAEARMQARINAFLLQQAELIN